MAPADPDSFGNEGSGGRSTRLLSLIAASVLTFVALLTNAAAQPDCKTIDDFSRAKVGEFPADWKPRKDSGKDAYRVMEEPGLRFLRAVVRGRGVQAAREYEWDLDGDTVLAGSWRPSEFPKGGA